MTAPYTGGCQCGSVRYVVTMEPIRVLACHCKECQRQSASAFGMSMPVKKDSLTVTGPRSLHSKSPPSGAPTRNAAPQARRLAATYLQALRMD